MAVEAVGGFFILVDCGFLGWAECICGGFYYFPVG